jgi:hypothetical protein
MGKDNIARFTGSDVNAFDLNASKACFDGHNQGKNESAEITSHSAS